MKATHRDPAVAQPQRLESGSAADVAGQKVRTWRGPLATAAAVTVSFVLLQLWRPYFFLTDDNMSGVLPGFADLGYILLQGKFPQKSELLYAGTYGFWQDPGAIALLFPVHIFGMLLATTVWKLAVVDAISLFNLLAGALAMRACVAALCRRFERPLPDWMAVFIAVSYVTSVYSLAVGSSWFSFLANQAAMPMIALGLVTERRKTGIVFVLLGTLYNLVGGHLAPFFYMAAFVGLLCVGLAAIRKEWEPVVRFASGSFAALLLVAPILWRLLSTFSASSRNTGFAAEQSMQYNLSFPALILGAVTGVDTIGGWDLKPTLGYLAEVPLPLSFSAVALCFLGILVTLRRFRAVDWLIVVLLLLVALFVHRPAWLQSIISHVPLYRSLRWPMREVVIFLFFAHVLVALGWHRFTRKVAVLLPLASAAAYIAALSLTASPTFNRFPVDRLLLLEGRAERVWSEVRRLMPHAADCHIVPLLEIKTAQFAGPVFIGQAPHTLLGAYNYPALFGMKSATGYSMPGFEQSFRGQVPLTGPGYFFPAHFAPAVLQDPTLLFARLASLDPVIIEYRSGNAVVHAVFRDGLANEPVVSRVQ